MSDLVDRLFLDIRSRRNTAKCFSTQCGR